MAEKVTWMVLKADLQCPSCCKKVKKLLCKFPQIRDQVYDEKKNLVTITVVCCSPEKIRDKLCCKGGKVIHSIDILEPPKPKPPPEKPKDPPPPKPAEKPKDPPKPAEKPKDPPKPAEKPKDPPKPAEKPKDPPKPVADPPKKPDPAQPKEPVVLPPPAAPAPGPCPAGMYPVPVGYFGTPCYGNYGPCPCQCCDGYGRPALPPPCYDNYGYGYNRGCYASRCDYFSEENTSGCTIM